MLTGTIVNTLAILTGSAVGMLISALASRFSNFLPRCGNLGFRLQAIINNATALCVLLIGITGCMDRRMRSLGDLVQEKTKRLVHEGGKATVAEGFVTASLLFCVGAMAIVGALNDGLTGDHTTLFAKSLLDGIIAVVFASSLGIGVAFSAAAVFLYQGAIALLASVLAPYLQSGSTIAEMTCVGSLLIIALSLNMLGLTKIKVMNLVPAIFLPILLCQFL